MTEKADVKAPNCGSSTRAHALFQSTKGVKSARYLVPYYMRSYQNQKSVKPGIVSAFISPTEEMTNPNRENGFPDPVRITSGL